MYNTYTVPISRKEKAFKSSQQKFYGCVKVNKEGSAHAYFLFRDILTKDKHTKANKEKHSGSDNFRAIQSTTFSVAGDLFKR